MTRDCGQRLPGLLHPAGRRWIFGTLVLLLIITSSAALPSESGPDPQPAGTSAPTPADGTPDSASCTDYQVLRNVLGDRTIDVGSAELDEERGRLVEVTDEGYRLILTLDPGLQAHLTEVVHRRQDLAEALVAVDPFTGRVLAWIEDTSDASSVEHPAVSSEPWAASIFKIVTGTALVEGAGVDPDETLCVSRAERSVELADLTANPSRDRVCVNMIEAMAGSVNAYFARQTDAHLPAEELTDWLVRFGFNQEVPFELPVEMSSATVPEDRLERARMGSGFRHAHLSPLHGALIAAAVANGGLLMQPTLVEAIEDPDGRTIYRHEPTVLRRVMHCGTARVMSRVMSRTAVSGTARRYFANRTGWPADLDVAGKTGTLTNRSEENPNPDPLVTYTWFVGFAPLEDPDIAVSSLIYNGPLWQIRGSYLASEAILHHWQSGP